MVTKATKNKVTADDFIREALGFPEIKLNKDQAAKLVRIALENTSDVPYVDIFELFIHRLNGDDNAQNGFKETSFDTVVEMLPLLSKLTTEYKAQKKV